MIMDDFYEWLARQDADWFLRAMDPRTMFARFLEESALNPLGVNVFSTRRFEQAQRQRRNEYNKQHRHQVSAAQKPQMSLF